MAVKTFQPSEYKEQAKQLLREGKTPEEVAVSIPVSTRTLYRYLKEVQNEKAGIAPAGKRTQQIITPMVSAPGVAKEAFTPLGTVISAPPPTSPTQEHINIGVLRMPLEDFGYSNSLNLFVVAATYDQASKEYGFDKKKMKVGDFMANLCQTFRMMLGWDVIGGGYLPPGDSNKEVESSDNTGSKPASAPASAAS